MMLLIRSVAVAVCLVTICLLSAGGALASQDVKRAPDQDALNWLGLVDQAQYQKSWEEAAGAFKAVVSLVQWEKAMKAVRAPLGKVISRKLVKSEVKHSLPGAPDGTYTVFKFDTVFEKKKKSVETLTFVMEKDEAWKAVGYLIQ